MKYDVEIIIDNIKNNGTLIIDNQQLILEVNNKIKNIHFNKILAIKQISSNCSFFLLSNKQVIIIKSQTNINLSNEYIKWKKGSDYTIKINNKVFKSIYTYSNPFTTLLIMLITFLLIYDGLIGISLSDSLEVNPILAFLYGMVFGFVEYPVDLIHLILFISIFICIVIELIYQRQYVKEVEFILNNCPIDKEEY